MRVMMQQKLSKGCLPLLEGGASAAAATAEEVAVVPYGEEQKGKGKLVPLNIRRTFQHLHFGIMVLLAVVPCILLLVASSAALPVQLLPLGSNISTGPSLFSPGAGQEWGPDVSHYQGDINWAEVKKAGASFAFAKATEGLTFVDASLDANRKGMRAEGFSPRGYYHFGQFFTSSHQAYFVCIIHRLLGHPNESAASQAAHFCKTVGALEAQEVAVLDIESATNADPAQVAQWSKEFVDKVMSTLGLPASRVLVCQSSPPIPPPLPTEMSHSCPDIPADTGAWFWNPQAGGSSLLSAHPLWVSGYTKEPPMPKGWSTWAYWQYTDKATIAGIKGGVDCSVKK